MDDRLPKELLSFVNEVEARSALPSLVPVRPYRNDWDERIRRWEEALASGDWPVRSRPSAEALIAGLYLCNESLDHGHRVAQSVETRPGSYWHAIMHRMEPDYDNAKYWFRLVGRHAIHDRLSRVVLEMMERSDPAISAALDPRLRETVGRGSWDAALFVEAVRDACSGNARAAEDICRRIQWQEMLLLLEDCRRDLMEDASIE